MFLQGLFAALMQFFKKQKTQQNPAKSSNRHVDEHETSKQSDGDGDQYTIERILGNGWMWKPEQGKWTHMFHVTWQGYDDSWNTWEPRSEIEQTEQFEQYIQDTDITYWTPKPIKNPNKLGLKKYKNIGSFTVSLEWNMKQHLKLFDQDLRNKIRENKKGELVYSLDLNKAEKQYMKQDLQL